MATETWILDGVKELNENEKVLFFIQYERERKRVSTGVLLAMFLGFAGIQKFYLGNVKAGVLSSLFAITIIPLILSLLDAANMENLVYDYNCFAAERIIDDIKYLRK
tara:strand:+ start:355 stop:675 length:321 start_codon:yes stop_codon:yes gene_type:complete